MSRTTTALLGVCGLAVAAYLVFFDQPAPTFPGASELGTMPGYGLIVGVALAFVSAVLLISTFTTEPNAGDSLS